MKKVGIIVFIVALVLGIAVSGAFSFGSFSPGIFSFNRSIKGSGVSKSDQRNVSEFKNIEVGGVFKVEVTIQDNFDVRVEADDNLLEYIKTDVDGETLEISTTKRISTRSPIIVRVGAPALDKIDCSGASKMSIVNLDNTDFTANISGASAVSAAGKTKNLRVELSGASRIDAGQLAAEIVWVEGSGASKADVSVSEKLDADLSGASRVSYSGSPKDIRKDVSGASSVRQN